jgi:hypothetical protein
MCGTGMHRCGNTARRSLPLRNLRRQQSTVSGKSRAGATACSATHRVREVGRVRAVT